MFKKLLFIGIMIVIFSGCKSGSADSAYEYSQSLVTKGKLIGPIVEAAEKKIDRFGAANKFDSVGATGEYIEDLLQKLITEITNTPVPNAKDADKFKAATLRYYNFIMSIYTGYKNLGKAGTPDARDKIVSELLNLYKGKQAALEELRRAQREFADANGFKLQ